MPFRRGLLFAALIALLFLAGPSAPAQSGNAGTIHGTVTDPSGAVIPNAAVHLVNSVSGLDRTATTDATGQFTFSNVSFNPYQISVKAAGFSPLSQSVEIRSVLGTTVKLVLQIAALLLNRHRRSQHRRPD